METCPCGSGLAYTECCEPLILGTRPAETAEQLMRARYTAYAEKKTDYIVSTTHPRQHHPDNRKTVEEWANSTIWHHLEIIECQAGGPEDDTGIVEFIAEYTEKGEKSRHHEVAEFKKEDGQWYFFDGHAPKITQYVREAPKIGRNDPCPCGSGKKYKKCCGK
ncbi:hypothetical protein DENIS_3054 [Desulfonema ishimotonii]|uniref:YchJ-like middle NTF2-like domain-containing protein n=1 Tax=Desulfonema ishimotonii TaxID=45657 RepID=A0A401FYP5_9BACT|nr:YchJ family protein [Desulfonema ishimotonii]GBC62091.1 hypothetical protein DENIS_3054 [Desulfonema ishimotonii]